MPLPCTVVPLSGGGGFFAGNGVPVTFICKNIPNGSTVFVTAYQNDSNAVLVPGGNTAICFDDASNGYSLVANPNTWQIPYDIFSPVTTSHLVSYLFVAYNVTTIGGNLTISVQVPFAPSSSIILQASAACMLGVLGTQQVSALSNQTSGLTGVPAITSSGPSLYMGTILNVDPGGLQFNAPSLPYISPGSLSGQYFQSIVPFLVGANFLLYAPAGGTFAPSILFPSIPSWFGWCGWQAAFSVNPINTNFNYKCPSGQPMITINA